MSIPIANEFQKLAPSALIELFVLDTSEVIEGGEKFYFHAGTNKLFQQIVWQGISYTPLPIEAEGFDKTTQGTLPTPKLRVANVDGLFSQLIYDVGSDLVGCKVIRKLTHARYLDAENFPEGNLDADNNQFYPDEEWFIERKTSEVTFGVIEWELSSVFDVNGVQLPGRQVLQNSCSFEYKGPDCRYNNSLYFDIRDQPCAADKDRCGKRELSCRLRHPTGTVPFGAFPGARRYAS